MTISTEDSTESQQDPELPEDPSDSLWDRPWAKGIFVAVVGLALILVAIAVGPHFASGGSGPKTAPQLATAAVRSFPVTESATGTVVPASQISVNFAAGGTISAIDTQVGAKVTEGTTLAQLDSTQARNSVAQAQAQLTSAQTNLAQAQAGDATNDPTLQANLTAAEAVRSQTQSAVAAANAQDAVIVAADNQQVATAQARFDADGCAAANPPSAAVCAADQAALTTAQNKLQLDQAQAASDQANGELRITNAQGQVNQAQAALQTASSPNAASVASAQAAVAAANSQLGTAEAALAATTVVAPIDGTVLQINGQVGETVASGVTASPTLPGTKTVVPAMSGTMSAGSTSSASPSEPFILIGDANSFVVGIAMPPNEVQQVHPNQACTITANTVAGVSQACRVLAVAQNPTLVNGSYLFYVTVVPDASTSQLFAGMSVDVSIQVDHADQRVGCTANGGVPPRWPATRRRMERQASRTDGHHDRYAGHLAGSDHVWSDEWRTGGSLGQPGSATVGHHGRGIAVRTCCRVVGALLSAA